MTGAPSSAIGVAAGPGAALLVTLAFAAGATDAFAFLLLGGFFTANHTGNVVLASLVGRPHYLQTLLGASTAVSAFILTLAASFHLTRDQEPGARRPAKSAARLLAAAFLFQLLALALALWLLPEFPQAGAYPVIAASAGAMAAQTAAARRGGADRNISTTFITGTLTGLMQDIADNRSGERAIRIAVLIALPLGALTCACVMQSAPLGGAVLAVLAEGVGLPCACGAVRQDLWRPPGLARGH